MEEKKIKKSFKDYYKNEEFKNKHQEYIKEKIPCECGCQVMRVGMARHKRSNIHNKNIKRSAEAQRQKFDSLDEYERINRMINEKLDKLLEQKIQTLKL